MLVNKNLNTFCDVCTLFRHRAKMDTGEKYPVTDGNSGGVRGICE